ncbi:MAG: nucleoside triphosphate pyrophosphohydrolase [Persephonella sp.]|nr:MAG: nucleoside triphosphate pyrophosphohydrolase [Persephonella sp.]
MKNCEKEGNLFQELVEIMERLRRECPWDREQTNLSIKDNLIEEAYELLEAIEENNNKAIIEELGDLLLQVLFHSQIKKDEGSFDINSVMENLKKKLIMRHPHVFGNIDYDKLEGKSHLQKWEKLKEKEKKRSSILDGIPKRMSALQRAYKIQKKMASVGFDWENIEGAWNKLYEELKELRNAKSKKDIEEEIGDIFQAMVNLARFYGVNPEDALHKSLDKSEKRFRYIEKKAKEKGKKLEEMSLDEMDRYWEEAKKISL